MELLKIEEVVYIHHILNAKIYRDAFLKNVINTKRSNFLIIIISFALIRIAAWLHAYV